MPIGPKAMKTKEPKKTSTRESPVHLVPDTKASGEQEAFSRFVGEGGPEGPMSFMEQIDRAFKNRLLGKSVPASPSNEIKSKPAQEP